MKNKLLKIYSFLKKIDVSIADEVGKIRVLFIISNTLGLSNLYPLIIKMKDELSMEVYITAENDELLELDEIQTLNKTHRIDIIPLKRAFFRKWHYAFTTEQSYLPFKRGVTLVFVHHGCGFGNSDKESKENAYHQRLFSHSQHSLYFLNSQSELSKHSHYVPKRSQKKFFISGLPKLDSLFQRNKALDKHFLETKRLDPHLKTIVISTHWKEKSLLSSLGASLVKYLLGLNEHYNILLISHEHLWNRYDNQALSDELETLDGEFENFLFLKKCPNHHNVIRAADLFICDYSSIFIEHCIIDKPIIYFQNPSYEFQSNEVKKLYEAASLPFSNVFQLENLIEQSLGNIERHKEQRKAVVEFFQSNHGEATNYIVNKVLEIGRISGPTSKRWQDIKEPIYLSK